MAESGVSLVNVLICKALNRLGIVNYLNVRLRVGSLRVPVLGGIGIAHLYEHEPWLTELLRMLLSNRSGAFVDVGVNVGQTLIRMLNCDPTREYYGFEPNPVCYVYVMKLKEINNLDHVCLVPVGLSNRTLMGQLFGNSLTDPTATTIKGFRGVENDDNGQFVPLCRGDDLLPGSLDVAVVKIDVEGGELEVLQGIHETLQRCRPFVVCEVLPIYDESTEIGKKRRARTDELLSLFESLNYKTAQLLHDGKIVPLETIETHGDVDLSEYLFYPTEAGNYAVGTELITNHRRLTARV
jgi:FkbM family methyltransferase